MAKEGKRSIGKIVLIVVVVLVIVGAIGSMGGKKTTTTAPDSAQQTEQSGENPQDASSQDKSEESTENLVVGTTVNLPDGLSVTVDSVEPGLTNFDGSAMTGVHVTYTNNGDDGASYNVYDWKGEDANGAQQNQGYYSEGSEELQSGTLAAGGTVAGNIYFDGDIKKALYFANMFDKSATASWVLA